MTDAHGFDHEIARAWRVFETDVANFVAAIRDNDVLVLGARYDSDQNELSACVQFFGWNQDLVRCEVPSNTFLHPLRRLTDEQHDELSSMGWRSRGSESFYRDNNRAWSDQLAHQAVHVLREMWSVPHPSFLKITTSGRYDTPEFAPTASASPDLQHVAVQPSGPAHLNALIDDALTPYFGMIPPRDSDGDVPIEFDNGCRAYLRVLESEPYIEVIATIVASVTRHRDAAAELVALNKATSDIKVVLLNNRILAVARVNAAPFVAEHLLASISALGEFLGSMDQTLIQRVGGTLGDSGDGGLVGGGASSIVDRGSMVDSNGPTCRHDEDNLPPSLLVLVGLHTSGPDIVDPVTTAAMCDNDHATIVEFVNVSLEQEIFWRRASLKQATLDEMYADSAEQDMCDAEVEAWSRTIVALRGALIHLNARAGSARSRGDQLELFETESEATLFDDIAD